VTRVLIDCRMAGWSGIGRYTHGLVRGLAATGELSMVLFGADGDAPILPDAERVSTVTGSRSPFSLGGMREFAQVIDTMSPDLVHCPHIPTPSRVAVPVVVTIHDLIPLVVHGVMPSLVRRGMFSYLTARAVRLAGRVIVPSTATATDVAHRFPVALGKIAVIAEAADDFTAGDLESRVPGTTELSPPYLLSMGNTKPHKDLPTLLEAFDRLAASHPELHLVLVGEQSPGLLDRLPPETRQRVRFTGRVSDAQLRRLYSDAVAFAFPSRYEGFGLPPLEAMALGTPVVVARAASLPEVVGEAALFFEPGDSEGLAAQLGRLLVDSESRARLVAAGRCRAAELTWDRAARATIGVYGEVLGA